MAIRYKNPATGEYEVIKIPVMKGEQGHSGIHVGTDAPPTTDIKLWFDPSDTSNEADIANRLDSTLTACVDYMGNDRGSIKAAADANVDWLLGEVNTAHYEGQHITATDTIEGHAKSALLKGQTLVNLVKPHKTLETYYKVGISTYFQQKDISLIRPLEPNKTYTIQMNITRTNGNMAFQSIVIGKGSSNGDSWSYRLYTGDFTNQTKKLGITKCLFTTPSYISETNFSYIKFISERYDIDAAIEDIMIIEGDYTNVDIPYFEGMASVKAPVLHSVGKNLFDGELENGVLTLPSQSLKPNNVANNNYVRSTNKISVLPNTVYTISSEVKSEWFVALINQEGNYASIPNNSSESATFTFTTPSDCYFIRFYKKSTDIKLQVQIEEGSAATPYEPYKSNTLSIPEDLELRGIGNVKDELNVATGELTQRIGEVVLDGSQSFTLTGTPNQVDTLCILFRNFPKIANGAVMSDKLITESNYDYSDFECITQSIHGIGIRLLRNKLESVDKNGVEKFLSQNPITVQYQFATESIKTVALSDNHIYSYKDVTHYDCSSADDSLVPTLSIDVPTNLPAVVTRQRATIQELEVENETLTEQLENANRLREEGDIELLSQDFEFDFRLMEVEFALGLPSAYLSTRGKSTMARTPYEMAKSLIELGKYEYEDMKRKLDSYLDKKRMTQAEYDELIAMMEADQAPEETLPEGDEIESAEENVINPDHGIMTLPLD